MTTGTPAPSELHTIVGEAIKTLADLGVSADQLGAFALQYPSRVAAVMQARPSHPEQPPDLEQIIHQQVVRAVREAMETQQMPAEDPTKVRMNVVVAGKRTSVTIQRSTIEAVAKAKNMPLRQARASIRQMAKGAPTDVENRSAWMEREVQRHLLLIKSASAGQAH